MNNNPDNEPGNKLRADIFQDGLQDSLETRLKTMEQHEQGTKVQYLYQLQGIPSLAVGVGAFVPVPLPPVQSFFPVVGNVIFADSSGGGAYFPNTCAAYLPVFIPSNVVINKMTLNLYLGPIHGTPSTDGAGTATAAANFYQVHGMKAYLSTMATTIPIMAEVAGGVGFAEALYDVAGATYANVVPPSATDISTQALGTSSLNLSNDSNLHTISRDITNLFSPGDAKIITFADLFTDGGAFKNASGSTIQAYVILEGYVHNR